MNLIFTRLDPLIEHHLIHLDNFAETHQRAYLSARRVGNDAAARAALKLADDYERRLRRRIERLDSQAKRDAAERLLWDLEERRRDARRAVAC